MDLLECDSLPVLPPEILNNIFVHLPSRELLLNIEIVCKEWYRIVNETQFWYQRLNYLGFPLSRDIRREFLRFADDEELLRSLQATCYHIEASQKKNSQLMFGNSSKINIARDMEDEGRWRITEDKLRVAAIMLCFRKPQLIEIELYSYYNSLKKVWLLVSQLANVDCEVHLKDFTSWRRPQKSSSDELVHRLTQSQARCQITLFRGSVQNLDELPSSIMNLSLSIGSDSQAASCTKGLAELTRRFPYLDELRVHIVPGLNVQQLPPLPSGRCQSSLFLSGVGSRHLRWAVNAANMLRPRGIDSQYRYLVFPSSYLIRQTSQKLLRFLEETNQVKFWELVIASPFLERKAESKLVTATRRFWPNCRGFTWIKLDEFLALSHYRW